MSDKGNGRINTQKVVTENRSVKSSSKPNFNTTLNTTNAWGTAFQAKDTGKRVEVRFNERKKSEPYFYWVYRWQKKDGNGKAIKRDSGTYVSMYEYGGKANGATDNYVKARIRQYQERKNT